MPKPADPPYLFKPVRDEDEGLGARQGMKTRRSRASVSLTVVFSSCLTPNTVYKIKFIDIVQLLTVLTIIMVER